MATEHFPAGIVGGTSRDLDITENIDEIRVEDSWGNDKFARMYTREVRERRSLSQEIGCTVSDFVADDATDKITIESASWDETEEVVIHEVSAHPDGEFEADKRQPLAKVAAITVRYKNVEGRITARYNGITAGSADTVLHADFKIDTDKPFTITTAEHTIATMKSGGLATVTLPVGTRIRSRTQRNVFDGVPITTEYEFSFVEEHSSTPPADFSTHLIDFNDTLGQELKSATIAYFGNQQLTTDHMFTIARSFNLPGDGSEEATVEQTITVYNDQNYDHS